MICASIGVAMPADKSQYGYLSEHHMCDEKPKETRDNVEELAAEMLATTIGILFYPDTNHDEKRKVFKMGEKWLRLKI